MEAITFLIGISGFILAFLLRPIKGLFIYFVGLFWYSQYLTVSIGTIDFTVSRIIILALLANIFFRTRLVRKFKWNLMDNLIVAYVFAQLIALTISGNVPVGAFVERQAGSLFDTILPYFAVRFIINSKERLITFIKVLIIIAIPLAVAGVYQCLTGFDPVGFMTKHFAWGYSELMTEMGNRIVPRLGFYRAYVTFPVPISYGLFFAGLAPLCIGLWKQKIWEKLRIIVLFVLMLIGILSSMSSAPSFSIAASMILLAFFPFTRFRGVFLLTFFMCFIIFIHLCSNLPFYEYLTRFAFSQEGAYYRINLVREALFGGMTGHWVAGYGYVGFGPGIFENIDFNWEHTDFVNIYIGILVRYGLLGLLPFLGINILYYRCLYQAAKRTLNQADLWLIWCILSTLIGWNIAMMTVSAMDQVNTLLFMLIGTSCNMPYIIMMANRLRKLRKQPTSEQSLSTVNTLTAY